jgi:formylglycine-generating enzyme required for sulfatase activity
MLRNGHHGVELDEESHQRISTWADLNAPFHGTWGEIVGPEKVAPAVARANEMRKRYAASGAAAEFEEIPQLPRYDTTPVIAKPSPTVDKAVVVELNANSETLESRMLDLGDGVTMELVKIPGGSLNGKTIAPFWIGRHEVTNRQLRRFRSAHDSRDESRHGYQFGRRGYDMNGDAQPAVRVSWNDARAFSRWLGEMQSARADLPSGTQWEWACRAGANTAFPFGPADADYSAHANLGDRQLKDFAACTARGGYSKAEPIENPSRYDDWIPRDDRFDDGGFVTTDVGRYKPNAWGLHDMIGNAWEWTTETTAQDERIARGGSWHDRPEKSTISARAIYQPFQRVFNVGFRIILEESPETAAD